ncbi:exo-alpha-sialidase [Pedobacter sp. ASV1-7]|uniref:exo-alpha-sialidase n=1 Tax=Pedobacter sp. ASV1-7 TaxID=3145237 RepID=UPI0032E85755
MKLKKNKLFLAVIFLISIKGYGQKTNFEKPPGIVITHQPASSGKYIGSPSICIRENGEYIASHDFFGPGAVERKQGVTVVYKSINKGRSWEKISTIQGQFWSNLYESKGVLYLMGTDKEYGNFILRKSADGGYNWTEPSDENSGLIFEGKYHTAPMPVLIHNGYLWRAVEEIDKNQKGWGKMFMSSMFSIPLNADLMKASNWRKTNSLPYDSTYLKGGFMAWLEGNALLNKQNRIVNLLRVSTQIKGVEKAALVNVSDDGWSAVFDRENGFIDFPGGSKKFSVRYDQETDLYWTLSNVIAPELMEIKETGKIRNTIALCSSTDLKSWQIHKYILHHKDMDHHGYQYIDWLFNKKDIVFVSRTAFDDAYGGVHRQHDANYLTFHKVKNFRKYKNVTKTKL